GDFEDALRGVGLGLAWPPYPVAHLDAALGDHEMRGLIGLPVADDDDLGRRLHASGDGDLGPPGGIAEVRHPRRRLHPHRLRQHALEARMHGQGLSYLSSPRWKRGGMVWLILMFGVRVAFALSWVKRLA